MLTGTRTITSRVESLSPGEYSGTLQFGADGAADDAADAKLPLLIQVRHHWWIPVLVILLGSFVGWFSSKYVVGARRASGLSQQVENLRDNARYLARHSARRAGWEFPSESMSLGYSRVVVSLNRLAKLSASTIKVLFQGNEIELASQNDKLRLAALKSVYDIRLRVQPVADGRPAAQLAIGRLLRRANDLLELPTFGDVEKASLAKLVDILETWANAATFTAAYKQAVLDRRRGSECPKPSHVQGFAAGPVRQQLDVLLNAVPNADAIAAQSEPDALQDSDVKIARLALLWRERDQPWATDLAVVCQEGKPLDDAFRCVDTHFWHHLKTAVKDETLKVKLDSASQSNPHADEIVEMNLESDASGAETLRILHHPLRVLWRIEPKNGQVRTTETDGLTLVQYFPSSGVVDIKATLRWAGDEIPINTPLHIQVDPNPKSRKRTMLSRDLTEYAAIAAAALFAIITAMGTQYDSTFGTMTQYFAMFIWAAGAGTGGNLFSQLGTTSAPGGAAAIISAPAATRT